MTRGKLHPTALKRWRKAKPTEALTVMVGGEPMVLQAYWRAENTSQHEPTKGKGLWQDIPLEEGLLP